MKKESKDKLSGIAQQNIKINRDLWGNREMWKDRHAYGYQWGGQLKQHYFGVSTIVEKQLVPFLPRPRNLDILEIAPGAGRMTTELIRHARSLKLVDLNEACIEMCRDRFKYYDHIEYFLNDGVDLSMIEADSVDLIFSFDSFVHIDKDVVAAYVAQFPEKLRDKGIVWIHHSATGQREKGFRSNMTDAYMRELAQENGLLILAQIYRNLQTEPTLYYGDCVTVMQKIVPEAV